MFDIGFFELILVSVVALLVLGPEKLPGAIRTATLWIGRLRRSFDNIKKDIEREIGADEIRRQLRNEAILEKFNESKKQLTEGLQAVKNETESITNEAGSVTKGLPNEKSGENYNEKKPAEKLPNDADMQQPAALEIDDDMKGFGAPRPAPAVESQEHSKDPDQRPASTMDNVEKEARAPSPEESHRRSENQ